MGFLTVRKGDRGERGPGRPRAEDSPQVRLSEDLYEAYRAGPCKQWLDEAHINVLLAKNQPFTATEVALIEARGLAPIAVSHLHRVRSQHVSKMAGGNPRFKAAGREDTDARTAQAVNYVFQYIAEGAQGCGLPLDYVVEKVVGDDFDQGRGVMLIDIDPRADFGRGEVILRTLDNDEVFIDPNASDPLARDAASIIIRKHLTREEAQRRFFDKRHLMDRVRWESVIRRDSTNYGARYAQDGQISPADIRDYWHEKALLLERFTKVVARRTLVTEGFGTEKTERLFTKEDYAGYRSLRAFLVTREAGPIIVWRDEDMAVFAPLYDEGLEMFGLADGQAVVRPVQFGQPAVSEQGQLVEPPVETIKIEPITRGDIIDFSDRGLEAGISARTVDVDRVRRVTSLGGVLFYDVELPTSHYPVVPLMTEFTGDPFPTAKATHLRPLVEQDNKTQQIIIAHAAGVAGVKVFGPHGGMDDESIEKLATPGADYIPSTAPDQIKPYNPPPLPNEFYNLQGRLKGLIDEISGQYPFQQGDPTNSPETYRATLFVSEAAEQRGVTSAKALMRTLNQAARVVLDYIKAVYTHEKTLRLIDPSGRNQAVTINEMHYDQFGRVVDIAFDVASAEVDVALVAGSTRQTQRFAEAEMLREVMQQIPAPGLASALLPHLLKKLDIPNWEEVVAQIDENQQLQQALQQAQQEIKRLSGDMQTADRELRAADRQVAREKFKSSLEAPKQQVMKASELATERVRDKATGQVALIDTLRQILDADDDNIQETT